MIQATTETFKELTSEDVVLVKFYTNSCTSCKVLDFQLEKVEGKIVKVEASEEAELAGDFGVFSVPVMVFMKDGQEVKRHIGFLPAEQIQEILGDLE